MRIVMSMVALATAANLSQMAWSQTAPLQTDQRAGQEDSFYPEEIVVTAQRRAENLQEVPLAVTALDSKALENRGITSLSSLTTSVSPGLNVTSYAGEATSLSINMRGASTADPGIGLADQGVAVYADGVPLGRAVGAGVELGDIERIEILRGPQGTLFGRNAEGGAVQFITTRPTGELGGRAEATMGNYDERRYIAHLDLPKIANVSIKLSGLFDKHDGYTDNAALRAGIDTLNPRTHEDFGIEEQRGGRIAVLWEPSSHFDALYAFDATKIDFTNSYTLRSGGPTPSEALFCLDPAMAAAYCADPTILAANLYRQVRAADNDLVPGASDVALYNPLSRTKIHGHTLILSYRPADTIELKSITGYRTLTEHQTSSLGTAVAFLQLLPSSEFASVPAGTQAAFGGPIATADVDQDQFSQELQFIGSFEDLDVTAGLFYFHEQVLDSRDSHYNLVYSTNGTSTLTPVTVNPFDLGPALQTFDAHSHSYAAYVQATYKPSSVLDGRLSITPGLRYNSDEKKFTRTVFNGAADGTVAPRFKEERVDPAIAIAFQATDDLNLYARYARAYRSGGVGIRNKLALTVYDPEVNNAVEVGLKSMLFARRVRFNVAGYHSRMTGVQVTTLNSALDPSSTDTLNLDQPMKVNGVETELTWSVTPELTVSGSYAYMKVDAQKTVGSALGPLGFLPPLAPKHTANVAIDYVRPIADTNAFMHVDYNYMSDYGDTPTQLPAPVASAPITLNQFNLRLGLRDIALGSTQLAVEGFVNNLFDKQEYNFSYQVLTGDPFIAPPGGGANGARPRTFGITSKVKF